MSSRSTSVDGGTRVGVYVDGFNLYYGAREQCGRGTSGWRWLDIAALAVALIDPHIWPKPRLHRLVYCTAPRDRAGDPSSIRDQRTYIDALSWRVPELEVEYGKYAPRTKQGVLVEKRPGRSARRVPSPGEALLPGWLPAREIQGPSGRAELLLTIATFEEKGSDVNVASLLLIDVLSGRIDAAMVFSNDSDPGCSRIRSSGMPSRLAGERAARVVYDEGHTTRCSRSRGAGFSSVPLWPDHAPRTNRRLG